MSEQSSNLSTLAPLEEIADQQVMKIIHVNVTSHRSSVQRMAISVIDRDGNTDPRTEFTIYQIDDSRVTGLLPSKCWVKSSLFSEKTIGMTFYSSTFLPDRARPFGDGPTYVCVIVPPEEGVVEYPVELRMFIDHIVDTLGTCHYVFCFGQEVYDKLIIKPAPLWVPQTETTEQ